MCSKLSETFTSLLGVHFLCLGYRLEILFLIFGALICFNLNINNLFSVFSLSCCGAFDWGTVFIVGQEYDPKKEPGILKSFERHAPGGLV